MLHKLHVTKVNRILYEGWSGSIPAKLREEVADLYLSRYKNIIHWGTGFNPTSDKFDSLYTDMTWVKVNRNNQDLEHEDLLHYTDMLVNTLLIHYILYLTYSN